MWCGGPWSWGWVVPHSSTLAWKIPWMEESGGLQSMGSIRVGHDWATSLSLFTFMHWRRKWPPTPVVLPGESQGQEPGGPPSMGSHRVGHHWCDLAAAAFIHIFSTHISICKIICLYSMVNCALDFKGLSLGVTHAPSVHIAMAMPTFRGWTNTILLWIQENGKYPWTVPVTVSRGNCNNSHKR